MSKNFPGKAGVLIKKYNWSIFLKMLGLMKSENISNIIMNCTKGMYSSLMKISLNLSIGQCNYRRGAACTSAALNNKVKACFR